MIFLTALLYSIKGGQHGVIRRYLCKLIGVQFNSRNNPEPMKFYQLALWTLLDGKVLSSIGFGLLTMNPLAGLAWLVGVSPSMGEEAGAIGGIRGNWRYEGSLWGWKKGLQRGVFLGAMLSLALNDTLFIVAGATFPIAYWIGISIEQIIKNRAVASWHIAEWIYGALIGWALVLHLA